MLALALGSARTLLVPRMLTALMPIQGCPLLQLIWLRRGLMQPIQVLHQPIQGWGWTRLLLRPWMILLQRTWICPWTRMLT